MIDRLFDVLNRCFELDREDRAVVEKQGILAQFGDERWHTPPPNKEVF